MDSPLPLKPQQPVTQEQLDWITAMVDHAADKRLRRYRNRAVVGFVGLVVGLAVALLQIGDVAETNRRDSVEARSVLCAIISDGDKEIYTYESEGTLTASQRERALAKSAQNRVKIGPAPGCTAKITPPPAPKGASPR